MSSLIRGAVAMVCEESGGQQVMYVLVQIPLKLKTINNSNGNVV